MNTGYIFLFLKKTEPQDTCRKQGVIPARAYIQVVLTSMEWNPREGKNLKFSCCVDNG